MKVVVKILLTQSGDLDRFMGRIKIAESEFTFELSFLIPFSRYAAALSGKSIVEFRKVIDITVSKNDAAIELTDQEYYFFYKLLMGGVLNIYSVREILRATNSGAMMSAIAPGEMLYEFAPETCKMLSAPKFDCILMDREIHPEQRPH